MSYPAISKPLRYQANPKKGLSKTWNDTIKKAWILFNVYSTSDQCGLGEL
jgi:hypothetical protein